ncbi:hypothetical protein ACFODO_12530 [Acinetobacter sichuanensis]|uniref:Uncharacterized protein n=1 Tax=Acinetobacter sichuanensis TaxID=2136183 RepID=A0A371YL61_9GAMM|nr:MULTISPECIES: hypothetical protein [Acinetobacter]MDM1246473.1 hypothetical protein [Acinetobacter sp. R933-2]MDM1762815.1 hypothetical protein [Acinetobacter sp. 226-1]MDM1766294.1 hypothetical protein [Acinetobacter sp. 226-4]MDQ9020786.1 hypothetical protein [Acinetobacter sichuanensis]RFC82218.1 hypothetical protein C9E89_017500 [Acinetobacter sichuanensis]
MTKKQPNKFIAPIVIAGITIGFLASAYKFVFAKPKSATKPDLAAQKELSTETVEQNSSDHQTQ